MMWTERAEKAATFQHPSFQSSRQVPVSCLLLLNFDVEQYPGYPRIYAIQGKVCGNSPSPHTPTSGRRPLP
jgi:hypothetical protein